VLPRGRNLSARLLYRVLNDRPGTRWPAKLEKLPSASLPKYAPNNIGRVRSAGFHGANCHPQVEI
jgi:hypothetical protein